MPDADYSSGLSTSGGDQLQDSIHFDYEISNTVMSQPDEILAHSPHHTHSMNTELASPEPEILEHGQIAEILDVHMAEAQFTPFYGEGMLDVEAVPLQPSYETILDGILPDASQANNSVHLPAIPHLFEHLQHLQHLQNEEEQAQFSIHHGTLPGNGTSPIPFVPSPSAVIAAMGGSFNFTQSSNLQHQTTQVQGSYDVEVGDSLSIPLLLSDIAEPATAAPAEDLDGSATLFQNTSSELAANIVWLDDESEADEETEVEDQYNLNLSEFLVNWARSTSVGQESRKRPQGPHIAAIRNLVIANPIKPMNRDELHGDHCDIQRISWADLGVSRFEAQQMRRQTYTNYTNLKPKVGVPWHPRINGSILHNDRDYFKFRRMDFDQDVHLSHFQLRNLLACTSRDHIFYAGSAKVLHYSATDLDFPILPSVVMDFTEGPTLPTNGYMGPFQISTLAVAHNIAATGGFNGEYGIANLRSEKKSRHAEGVLTGDHNAITNHVQVHTSRNSSLPLATFASNDRFLRTIDVNTNKIVGEYSYKHAINCTAMSPDQRLRVMVGDNRKVMICNSETGQIFQQLEGHRDFGFACDWADDGWTVATGNQDMKTMIWDARKWTTSSGASCPVATIAAEMAGVRKLKFSPLGSGKRVLLAAEPADFVSVINAETFTNKQTLSFFGEIGGVDFTNDGQDIVVANCDHLRGGIMHYERCNSSENGWRGSESRKRAHEYVGYDWMTNSEDIPRHIKSRSTSIHRARKPAHMGQNLVH